MHVPSFTKWLNLDPTLIKKHRATDSYCCKLLLVSGEGHGRNGISVLCMARPKIEEVTDEEAKKIKAAGCPATFAVCVDNLRKMHEQSPTYSAHFYL